MRIPIEMTKGRILHVKDTAITVIERDETDFISLTDMTAGFSEGSGLIGKWITNKNTLEHLGVWENIKNPDFNYTEFEVIISSPDKDGNIRDNATLEQLVVLSNMESINALLIRQGLTQNERLIQLNKTAIMQMKSLMQSNTIKKLK